MLQKHLRLAIFFSGLMISFWSCSQSHPKKIIHTIDFTWLEGCETGKGDCKPVLLTRQNIADSVWLVFPNGGTMSSVYLNTTTLGKALRQDHKSAGEGNPFLDLTGLPDGNYGAYMTGCAIGGGFVVVIKTN